MTVERYLRGIAGFFCTPEHSTGAFPIAVLASVYWLCGLESAAISFYQLVSNDDHT